MTDQNEFANLLQSANSYIHTVDPAEEDRDRTHISIIGGFPIFAPYVPLTQTPVVLDDNSFNRPEGMRGYGDTEIDQSLYGTMRISAAGIEFINRPITHKDYHWEEMPNWLKEGF